MRINRLLLLALIVLAGGISLAIIARPTAAPAPLGVVSARLAPGSSWPVAAPVTFTVQFDQNALRPPGNG